ncbi:MAG: hypothetical protein JJT96_17820, partial [Opitutales bacterium]|nr:hypothetical protein [Opitutales bacterium]
MELFKESPHFAGKLLCGCGGFVALDTEFIPFPAAEIAFYFELIALLLRVIALLAAEIAFYFELIALLLRVI